MLHGLVAMRRLIAMGLAAVVGAWGIHATLSAITNPFLGGSSKRAVRVSSWRVVCGYAALWFTTPFFGASLVLSLFAIAASRRDPHIRTRPLPAYAQPRVGQLRRWCWVKPISRPLLAVRPVLPG